MRGLGAGGQARGLGGVEHDEVLPGRRGLGVVGAHLAFQHVGRAFGMRRLELQRGARLQARVHQEHRRREGHRRRRAEGLAQHHAEARARARDARDLVGAVVRERRRALLELERQRHPELQAPQARAVGAQLVGRALGVGDAAAGRHPVHLARTDGHDAAEAVAMQDRALEQVAHGGQADVRVRPHVQALAGAQAHRAELVEEHERAHGAPGGAGQRPVHEEAVAEVGRVGRDHLHGRPSGRWNGDGSGPARRLPSRANTTGPRPAGRTRRGSARTS